MYRPPNTKAKEFIGQYCDLLTKLNKEKNKEIILGMDHNLDLLKAIHHKNTQDILDINFDNELLPCITRSTRITKSTATLIDDVFVSRKLHESFDSCVLVHDISDHLPSRVNLHNQNNNTTDSIEFESRSLNK